MEALHAADVEKTGQIPVAEALNVLRSKGRDDGNYDDPTSGEEWGAR
jgi:hypothetical protein